MPAYIFANLDVHDWKTLQRYREQMPALLAQFGGRYIIRGGDIEIAEGKFSFKRLIVIEFPDMKAARALYDSPNTSR